MDSSRSIFERLGLPARPVILAPLAGVSDHPFRRACQRHGADLTYVEMLSATALLYDSQRTLDMLRRHPSEGVVGVQITGRNADDTARAIERLDKQPFETIDINMGCPVKKVVKTGCGSAILRDPERVYQTTRLAKLATGKPLSIKVRLGWDRQSMNFLEIADAAEKGGADWITVHGRTRADDYSVPVDLDALRHMRQRLSIPMIGNGNLFSRLDAETMGKAALVDGFMVSRGALGNPWIFRFIKGDSSPVTLDDWLATILDHLAWQQEEYGDAASGAVCMRKHVLWYAKGWPGAKALREKVNAAASLGEARSLVIAYAHDLRAQGVLTRVETNEYESDGRFVWDPKYDMDRTLDRGVGDDRLEETDLVINK